MLTHLLFQLVIIYMRISWQHTRRYSHTAPWSRTTLCHVDLPTASHAVEIEAGLGLSKLSGSNFNMVPCVAKTAPGQQPDARLKDGVRWLLTSIDNVFGQLDVRVQAETAAVRLVGSTPAVSASFWGRGYSRTVCNNYCFTGRAES